MILIDDRDGSRDLADMPVLENHHVMGRIETEIGGKVVPVGDVLLTGHGPNGSTLRIGVELKSIHDLLSSISTGRLGGTQIPRMLKAFDVAVILFYGVYRCGPFNHLQVRRWKNRKQTWVTYKVGGRPVPFSFLEGWMLTASLLPTVGGGTPLIIKHVYDINEAAVWLRVLDGWLDKPWDRHRGLAVFDKSRELSAPPDADPVEFQIARTASSFPGLDWVRGWAAAAYFDSVREMVNADITEWQKIKGIGPVLSKEAVRAIRTRKGK